MLELGAFQNRFDHAGHNLDNINENVNASKSRIKDTWFQGKKRLRWLSLRSFLVSASILAQAKQGARTRHLAY